MHHIIFCVFSIPTPLAGCNKFLLQKRKSAKPFPVVFLKPVLLRNFWILIFRILDAVYLREKHVKRPDIYPEMYTKISVLIQSLVNDFLIFRFCMFPKCNDPVQVHLPGIDESLPLEMLYDVARVDTPCLSRFSNAD